MTTLDQILGKKSSTQAPAGGATKTAAAQPAGVDSMLDRILDGVGSEKTAAAQPTGAPGADPITALTKMAAEVASSQDASAIKLAHVQGRAFGAGIIAELNDYKVAADRVEAEKTAGLTDEDLALLKLAKENPSEFLARVQAWAQQGGSDKTASEEQAALEKWAQEDPAGFEAAVRAGYSNQQAALEKSAQAGYQRGYNDTMQHYHKLAADHFAMGYDATMEALAQVRK